MPTFLSASRCYALLHPAKVCLDVDAMRRHQIDDVLVGFSLAPGVSHGRIIVISDDDVNDAAAIAFGILGTVFASAAMEVELQRGPWGVLWSQEILVWHFAFAPAAKGIRGTTMSSCARTLGLDFDVLRVGQIVRSE